MGDVKHGPRRHRFVLTKHVRERYVMRFHRPLLDLDGARDFLAKNGRQVDSVISWRLHNAVRVPKPLDVAGMGPRPEHGLDGDLFRNREVLFVCKPISEAQWVVVTCCSWENFAANAERIVRGEAPLKDEEVA